MVVGGAVAEEQDYRATQRQRAAEADWLVIPESERPTVRNDG